MPLSPTAENFDLDSSYGASHGSEWPAVLYLALYAGDPLAGGTELSNAGGYARVSVANTGAVFAAASVGSKTTNSPLQFPISTGAWSATPDHFAFMDAAAAGNILETGTLALSSPVSAANTVVVIAAGALTIGF